MEKDEQGWYVAKLFPVGEPTRGGHVYPPEAVAKAMELLKERYGGQQIRGHLHGECQDPLPRRGETEDGFLSRVLSIDERNVSHKLDVSSMEVKDGFMIAKVMPAGPMAKVFEAGVEAGNIKFAMRDFDKLARDFTTKFTRKDDDPYPKIITFDLTTKP